MKFALFFLIVSFALISNSQGDYVYDRTAQFCDWLRQNYGYRCDGPVERWIWERYHQINGIRDCNDLCVRVQRRSGGRCILGAAVDRSIWCPFGQKCECF